MVKDHCTVGTCVIGSVAGSRGTARPPLLYKWWSPLRVRKEEARCAKTTTLESYKENKEIRCQTAMHQKPDRGKKGKKIEERMKVKRGI